MRPYNRYLITLSAVLSLSTTVLAAYGVRQLDAYYSAYVIEALIVTLLFGYLHPRASRALNRVGYVLVAGFVLVVAIKVASILGVVRSQ
jgi:hypothetical protein